MYVCACNNFAARDPCCWKYSFYFMCLNLYLLFYTEFVLIFALRIYGDYCCRILYMAYFVTRFIVAVAIDVNIIVFRKLFCNVFVC